MWRGRSARLVGAAVAVVALAALSACASDEDPNTDEPAAAEPNGIQDLEPDEIVAEMQDAVGSATSVRATGGGASGGSTIEIDLQLGSDGDATGTLINQGQQIEILATGGTVYFSADEEFWTAQAGPEAAAQLAGKYVEVPADDDSFSNFADYDTFFDELLTSEGDVEVGEETTVDGVAALELIDTKDDGILYVALEGEPLPLKIVPAEGGELILADWNADFTVEAPAADEIVDPNTLLGQ